MELKKIFERTVEIRDAAIEIRNSLTEPAKTTRQRLAQSAQELSLAGDNQARVEVLNEAVLATITLLYECDPDGVLCNVDHVTYRLLIPAPWGRAGWRTWGLRYWESEVLRKILIVRGQMRRVQPLFDYSADSHSWYLNLSDYNRLDLALNHWKQNQITMRDWRKFADVYRSAAHKRTARNRTNSRSEPARTVDRNLHER